MPKTVNHDEYRRELLRKCFGLFGRTGFSNVTMRQIAEEIGVSTGTLYHYFSSKLNILEQMFAWAVEEDIEAYSREADQAWPMAEKVARISEFWAASGTFYQHLLLLGIDLFRNSPGGGEEVFQDFADHYNAAIARSLGTSPRLSEVIFTYLLGVVVHSLLTPKHFSYHEQARFVPEVLRAIIEGCDENAARGMGDGVRATVARPADTGASPPDGTPVDG